ncbi:MAG: hypothetical protein R3286_12765 [Gammaproteobacteria bacterium]|nr:hypothetical protein [Gammaproteobacteria bacterium]
MEIAPRDASALANVDRARFDAVDPAARIIHTKLQIVSDALHRQALNTLLCRLVQ